MKRTSLAATVALAVAAVIGINAPTAATRGSDHKQAVCHPVNGHGSTGTGWNLIAPDKASSHIDEATGAGKHHTADGRTDVYAVDGACPSSPSGSPSPTTGPAPTTDPDPTATATVSGTPTTDPGLPPVRPTAPETTPTVPIPRDDLPPVVVELRHRFIQRCTSTTVITERRPVHGRWQVIDRHTTQHADTCTNPAAPGVPVIVEEGL